jgi:SOS-response transcriptional repressor LexA
MMGLTAAQRKCLEALKALEAAGQKMTYDAIGKIIDNPNKGAIHRLLTALDDRGHIRRIKGKAGAIEIIDQDRALIRLSPAVVEGLEVARRKRGGTLQTVANEALLEWLGLVK